jgi:hypothetical protein
MSTQIQRRRGTTAEHSTFTGVEGELTVDTTKDTAVVHDGTTVGGHPLQKQYPPLGNAAAPTYTFTGDTNTGIYSPGADQVAVATNGTQRLLIKDASQDTLRVSGVNAVVTADAIGSNYPGFRLAVNGSVLAGFDGDGGTSANLFTYAAVPLVFGIDSSERMRITSAGLVGIGTSAPVSGAQLTVAGAALAVTGQNLNHSANSIRIGQEGSGAAQIRCYGPNTSTNGSLTFKMSRSDGANSQDVVIDGSGRLGIGTSTPATVVDIEASADAYITIQPGTTDGNVGLLINNSAGTQKGVILYDTDDNYMLLSTENTERMRIDSSGRVGIGTQSPATSLHLLGANTPARGQLSVAGNGDDARITFYRDSAFIGGINADTTNGVAIAAETGYSITFNPGGTSEKGRFDSSGRLLVGTSTSRNLSGNVGTLQIEGTTNYQVAAVTTNTNDAYGSYVVLTKSRGTSLGSNTIVQNNDSLGGILFNGTDGANAQYAAQIQAYVDGTPGTADMPGRLVFSTTADGASSPTERARITNAGYFKATSTGDYYGVTSGYHESRTGLANNVSHLFSHSASTGAVYGIQISYAQNKGTSTGDQYIYCNDSAAVRMEVRGNGGIANYSGNNVNLSDRNAKKDISPASDTWDCIKEWEIVNYRYKDQPDDADLNLGVVAQQVAESCPEVITVFQEAKEATEDQPAQEERLGVKEQQMYWMAIKALQEAQVRIEQLEQRLTDAGIA